MPIPAFMLLLAAGSPAPTHSIQNVVGWWDQSQSGGFATDRVGSANLTLTATATGTLGTGTGIKSSGGTTSRAQTGSSPLNGLSVFGVTLALKGLSDGPFPAPTMWHAGTDAIAVGLNSDGKLHLGSAVIENWDGAAHVWYFEMNGSSSKVYKDGSIIGTTFAPGSPLGGASLAILNVIGGGNQSNLVIGEVKVTTGTQTAPNISSESAALHTKWGI